MVIIFEIIGIISQIGLRLFHKLAWGIYLKLLIFKLILQIIRIIFLFLAKQFLFIIGLIVFGFSFINLIFILLPINFKKFILGSKFGICLIYWFLKRVGLNFFFLILFLVLFILNAFKFFRELLYLIRRLKFLNFILNQCII